MKAVRLFCLILCLGLFAPLVAQEGHPMSGTWSGDWGTSPKGERNHTTLILQFDGKAVTGLVDPGPDSATIRVATLDSRTWTVRFEYDLKDKNGKASPFVVTAKLENASSRPNRAIVGTYTHAGTKGDFKIKLDL
jgi:hypothetical protein